MDYPPEISHAANCHLEVLLDLALRDEHAKIAVATYSQGVVSDPRVAGAVTSALAAIVREFTQTAPVIEVEPLRASVPVTDDMKTVGRLATAVVGSLLTKDVTGLNEAQNELRGLGVHMSEAVVAGTIQTLAMGVRDFAGSAAENLMERLLQRYHGGNQEGGTGMFL